MEVNSNARAQEIEQLRLIYYEILAGVTPEIDTKFYIKHFSESESHLLAQKRSELILFYVKEGVPNDAELLKNAIANEEWSEDKENYVRFLKQAITDNEQNLNNLIIEQRHIISARIDEDRKELSKIQHERQEILGRSVEDLVDEDINEYVAYLSFYKDKKCSEHLLPTYEEFQNQDMEVISRLNKCLYKYSQRVNDESIQKIACFPIFLNKFSYCKDNVYQFLGVPMAHLTHHQNYLVSLGARNLFVGSQSKGTPPDLNTVISLEESVKWYNREHSIITAKMEVNEQSTNRRFKQV